MNSGRGIITVDWFRQAIAATLMIAPGAAAAQEFPVPRPGTVIHLSPMAEGQKDARERVQVTKVDGDAVLVRIEGRQDGGFTMRFLIKEGGPAGAETCAITKGADRLGTIAVGAQIPYEVACEDGRGTTANIQVRRTIMRKQRITVQAGTFDTVVIQDAADVDTVMNGRPLPRRHVVDRFWFAPSVGFYVRKTSWTGSEPPPDPPRWEASLLRSEDAARKPEPQARTAPPAEQTARPNANDDAPAAKPQAKPAPKRTATRPKPAPRRQRAETDGESVGPPALNCQSPAQWAACANRALSTLQPGQ